MISFRHIPIRIRLSLWYTLLTALVLVIFSFALYIGLKRQLSDYPRSGFAQPGGVGVHLDNICRRPSDPRSRHIKISLPTS